VPHPQLLWAQPCPHPHSQWWWRPTDLFERGVMDDLFGLHGGLFLRREAVALGYTDRELGKAVRSGTLAKVRHGAYVDGATWSPLRPSDQHLLRARAVLLSHPSIVALSHVSGALASGLRVWGADLSKVHVARGPGGTARRTRDVVHHVGGWSEFVRTTDNGVPSLSPAACGLGLAAISSVEAGLVALDSVLHLGLANEEELVEAYERLAPWPHARRLQITTRLARKGAESVGESRLRYLCWRAGIPMPVLQYDVYDNAGRLIGKTDFAWPEHRLLGEFDGKVKFGRFLRPGESPGDAAFREKVREDRLREATGWSMARFVWSDLSEPEKTVARLRHHLLPAGARESARST
jgi:hypothetical protein